MARPKKQPGPEEQTTFGNYTLEKPSDQWVVKLGGSVVYASPQKDQVDKYLELVTRK